MLWVPIVETAGTFTYSVFQALRRMVQSPWAGELCQNHCGSAGKPVMGNSWHCVRSRTGFSLRKGKDVGYLAPPIGLLKWTLHTPLCCSLPLWLTINFLCFPKSGGDLQHWGPLWLLPRALFNLSFRDFHATQLFTPCMTFNTASKVPI